MSHEIQQQLARPTSPRIIEDDLCKHSSETVFELTVDRSRAIRFQSGRSSHLMLTSPPIFLKIWFIVHLLAIVQPQYLPTWLDEAKLDIRWRCSGPFGGRARRRATRQSPRWLALWDTLNLIWLNELLLEHLLSNDRPRPHESHGHSLEVIVLVASHPFNGTRRYG